MTQNVVANNCSAISVPELVQIVSSKLSENDEVEVKRREDVIIQVAERFSKAGDMDGLKKLVAVVRPHLLAYGKAKAAKLIRTLIDFCLCIDSQPEFKLELCTECINWARTQNLLFLRHMLEMRMMRLLNELGKHTEAIAISVRLNQELKKVENKDIKLEVDLEESRAGLALNNFNRAKTALVSARSIANTLCIDSKIQGNLDMQAGILNMADDRDFKTAFSYFYEAFENFDTSNEAVKGEKALMYMCLAKIMLNEAEEVDALLTSKLASKYSGRGLKAMKCVAEAYKERSLKQYQKAFEEYKHELESDPIVKKHLDSLHDGMLEKDIGRAIEPYSLLEIKSLATNMNVSCEKLERKLARMILDKKFHGVIDQEQGTLTIHSLPPDLQTKTFVASTKIIHNLTKLIDEIYRSAMKI